ncbi:carboxypeptidase regulatory-like domain-containing protein [Streptomyces mutabilis]|uniref:Membrane protein n=1 Tax=Streptomyces mutabilis TaxID=67332 RepID=A0A086MVE7_9ACTN|nr:carboxypeptidase regulatory-like domain-containing protein [Streptomyces mutabilis]KFG72865.1 membrane protein [Streptomyces mutabilis]
MNGSVGQQGNDQDRPGVRLRSARTLLEAAWFPAALFLGFLFSFAPALHSPQPHHAEVVVAGSATAREVDAALERTAPGGFDVTAVSTPAETREAVRDRTAVAGYAAGDHDPVLFVAKANGASLKQAVTSAFAEVAAEHSGRLDVRDVAPTVAGDRLGTTLVYFAIAWSVPGYILATTLLRAVTFDRRRKVLSILGVSALFSAVGYGVGVGLGYLPHSPVTLPVAFLLTAAVATFASGLAPFTRQFFPAVGMTLFIVLSIPTSGGVAPAPMLPTFFQYVHTVMPLGNAVDALRSALYFDGAGLLKPILVLGTWFAVGAALLALDAHLHQRKAARLDACQEVQEPPVDDPALETPIPTAIPVHPHHFGEPAPDLVGTVRDTWEQPVRHAAVTVLGPDGRHLVSTSTNARGQYAVTGLPEDHLGIVVSSPGHQPAVQRRLLRSGEVAHADFVLQHRHAVACDAVGS